MSSQGRRPGGVRPPDERTPTIQAPTAEAGSIKYGTPAGRWVILATVLGSGVAFLDGTVVNVALPAISRDFHTGLSGLQWTIDAYLLTLGSLLLLGGSIGDIFGRRRAFILGLGLFSAASLLSGLAPNAGALIGARALQGIGGAFLVPESLAIISATFHASDRGAAIGAWSGLAGIATAIGPFLGGWLVDSVSWRLVFFINLPIAAMAAWIVLRHVPESRDPEASRRLDLAGAATATLGLAGLVYALIEGPTKGFTSPKVIILGLLGAAFLVAFPFVERRVHSPMVPLDLFKSRQFTGANLTTLAVYAALGGAFFFIVVELQTVMGYSALQAGASLVPVTVLMFALSARAGRLAQRIGPRLPMTVGPLVAGAGFVLLSRMHSGSTYFGTVFPGVLVFGLGLSFTVAPLTSAVLGAVEDRHAGVGSGFNNAVSRVAGLLAVALLPVAAGFARANAVGGPSFAAGFSRAMWISAGLCWAGGLIAFVTIREAARVRTVPHPSPQFACHDEALIRRSPAGAAVTSGPGS